jgi:hypothetical protein
MINVWIAEKSSKEPYCLVERADDRSEALEALEQAILTDGVVPNWIKSVDFYEQGDSPAETYRSGDVMRNK